MGLEVKIDNNISEKFQEILSRLGEPLVRAIDTETAHFIGRIQQDQMTGRKGDRYLNIKTNALRNSWLPRTSIQGDTISTKAFSNVKYAAIHQYGGTVRIPARQSVLSFEGRRGRFVSPSKKAFMTETKGQRQQKVHVGAHDIHIPKRLYIVEAFEKEMPARYLAVAQKVILGK